MSKRRTYPLWNGCEWTFEEIVEDLTGRFRDEVHALRRELGWHLTLITILLAEMLSVLIRNSIKMDEETTKAFGPAASLRLLRSAWLRAAGKLG